MEDPYDDPYEDQYADGSQDYAVEGHDDSQIASRHFEEEPSPVEESYEDIVSHN